MFDELISDDDTDPKIKDLLYEKIMRLNPTERMQKFFDLCALARGFAIAGIKARHPNCSDQELKKRFAAIALGREFTLKYFQWDPEIEGY